MPRVPANVSDLIGFCGDHATLWTGATGIGITAADVTKLKADLSAAQAALAAQLAAKTAAKNTTLNANGAVSTLRKTITTLVRTIVSFAEAQAKPDAVFSLAGLEPNAPRSPSAPPGEPRDLTATLNNEGQLTLKWKCENPPGGNVVYSVMRRNGPTGPFNQVGLVGKRTFVDSNIPAGVNGVTYQIKGVRGETVGPASMEFTLRFGNAGGGGGDVAEKATQLKMAA